MFPILEKPAKEADEELLRAGVIGAAVAAGILYPFLDLLLTSIPASAAMTQRLRKLAL